MLRRDRLWAVLPVPGDPTGRHLQEVSSGAGRQKVAVAVVAALRPTHRCRCVRTRRGAYRVAVVAYVPRPEQSAARIVGELTARLSSPWLLGAGSVCISISRARATAVAYTDSRACLTEALGLRDGAQVGEIDEESKVYSLQPKSTALLI